MNVYLVFGETSVLDDYGNEHHYEEWIVGVYTTGQAAREAIMRVAEQRGDDLVWEDDPLFSARSDDHWDRAEEDRNRYGYRVPDAVATAMVGEEDWFYEYADGETPLFAPWGRYWIMTTQTDIEIKKEEGATEQGELIEA